MKQIETLGIEDLFSPETIEAIKEYLINQKETIAVAESVTTGLLQLALGTTEKVSFYYQGGITAYNLGQKYRHLLIEPIHAQQCDCISQGVAGDMALQVCKLFKSNWGLSVTGYATPVEQSGNKLYAYISVAYNGEILLSEKITPKQTQPFAVQLEYANSLLQQLLILVKKVK
jgi:nicotinamide-nucleotide amidase